MPTRKRTAIANQQFDPDLTEEGGCGKVRRTSRLTDAAGRLDVAAASQKSSTMRKGEAIRGLGRVSDSQKTAANAAAEADRRTAAYSDGIMQSVQQAQPSDYKEIANTKYREIGGKRSGYSDQFYRLDAPWIKYFRITGPAPKQTGSACAGAREPSAST